jgi:tetratricopeptide (TPR) repeat protein
MEFASFFPDPPELKRGQKWHVFISYRSTDRPWVLRLYDALRQLKYEVFVDQFVLSAGAPLASSLGDGIDKSAAAIIVWSKNYATSNWTEDEYNALKSRRNSDSNFGLGVARKDTTDLPGLLAGHIFTDFSQLPEGPCGEALLRLLLGMAGRPLPPGAVQLANEIDVARKKDLVLIKAARQNDDPGLIIELAKSQNLAWTTSPMLGCAAAEALIAAEQFDAANAILLRMREYFPGAVRPRQLEGLAARRRGDWQAAMRILGAMYADDFRDSETLGMYASTWRARYRESGNRLHLIRSRDLYREGFETSADSYTGINAAMVSLLLGEYETSRQLAARVEDLFKDEIPDDYYEEVTLAEARLLQGDYAQARLHYAAAILRAPGETGSHKGSLEQAREIMNALETPPADRDAIENVFGHLKKAAKV